jgi:hypothetical protein
MSLILCPFAFCLLPFALPRRGRGWIWFFAVLGILAVLAITIPIVYNLRQQLKLEDLEAARALWQQKRPSDYDLTYTKRGSVTGTFVVRVRAGQVVDVTMDGQPVEERLYRSLDMTALLEDLEEFLRLDARPGSPRAFNQAVFDPADGHLIRYVRSVTRPRQRLEILARLEPRPAAPAP